MRNDGRIARRLSERGLLEGRRSNCWWAPHFLSIEFEIKAVSARSIKSGYRIALAGWVRASGSA